MSRHRRPRRIAARAAVSLCALLAAGCASSTPEAPAGAPRAASTVRVAGMVPLDIRTEAGMGRSELDASPSRVWAVLPAVFEQLSVPVNTRNTGALQMGNAGVQTRRVDGKRMSTYLDCGSTLAGRRADMYDVTLALLVRLSATEGGGTMVTTTVDATAKPRSVSGDPVHCQSTGGLERRVAEIVAEQLALPAGGS